MSEDNEYHVHPYRHGTRDHNQLAGGIDFVALAGYQREEIERLKDELATAKAENEKLRAQAAKPPSEVERCFIRDEPLLHFLNVMSLLEDKYGGNLSEEEALEGGNSVHDMMFDMWPDWAAERQGNDSYWHLYRHWIPTETGRTVWDLMCLELGIEQDIEKMEPKIVFWVSW